MSRRSLERTTATARSRRCSSSLPSPPPTKLRAYVGRPAALSVLFAPITTWTGAGFWPDAVLMAAVANADGTIGSLLLAGLVGAG